MEHRPQPLLHPHRASQPLLKLRLPGSTLILHQKNANIFSNLDIVSSVDNLVTLPPTVLAMPK
jgi:hypothetical protein